MMLFMKGKLESKAQIYAIYWKSENLLNLVWKIIYEVVKERLSFFDLNLFLEKLEAEVMQQPQYSDDRFIYLPREVYVECIMKVFYDLFYPSEQNNKKWKKVVQQTFQ